MNNEELKKKIAKIIDTTEKPCNCFTVSECLAKTGCKYHNRNDGTTCFSYARAEALIAAGIGDVSELKKHRVVVEKSLIPEDDNAYVLPNIPPTVKQIYSGEEVEQIVKEREEYKHRAEVAERALNFACLALSHEYGTADMWKEGQEFYRKRYITQAEKELGKEGENERP